VRRRTRPSDGIGSVGDAFRPRRSARYGGVDRSGDDIKSIGKWREGARSAFFLISTAFLPEDESKMANRLSDARFMFMS
jgi:hypothetical protein